MVVLCQIYSNVKILSLTEDIAAKIIQNFYRHKHYKNTIQIEFRIIKYKWDTLIENREMKWLYTSNQEFWNLYRKNNGHIFNNDSDYLDCTFKYLVSTLFSNNNMSLRKAKFHDISEKITPYYAKEQAIRHDFEDAAYQLNIYNNYEVSGSSSEQMLFNRIEKYVNDKKNNIQEGDIIFFGIFQNTLEEFFRSDVYIESWFGKRFAESILVIHKNMELVPLSKSRHSSYFNIDYTNCMLDITNFLENKYKFRENYLFQTYKLKDKNINEIKKLLIENRVKYVESVDKDIKKSPFYQFLSNNSLAAAKDKNGNKFSEKAFELKKGRKKRDNLKKKKTKRKHNSNINKESKKIRTQK